jgi:hypothetical protein
MEKREIVWDLSGMFPSTTDPLVKNAVDELTKRAESLASEYQGRIMGLPAETLLKAIKDFEEYNTKLDSSRERGCSQNQSKYNSQKVRGRRFRSNFEERGALSFWVHHIRV